MQMSTSRVFFLRCPRWLPRFLGGDRVARADLELGILGCASASQMLAGITGVCCPARLFPLGPQCLFVSEAEDIFLRDGPSIGLENLSIFMAASCTPRALCFLKIKCVRNRGVAVFVSSRAAPSPSQPRLRATPCPFSRSLPRLPRCFCRSLNALRLERSGRSRVRCAHRHSPYASARFCWGGNET